VLPPGTTYKPKAVVKADNPAKINQTSDTLETALDVKEYPFNLKIFEIGSPKLNDDKLTDLDKFINEIGSDANRRKMRSTFMG
jgi:hypothetical protein